MSITLAYKDQCVTALLECKAVTDQNTRNRIVDELPHVIRDCIERSSINVLDVFNIVTKCLNSQGGIEALLQAVNSLESNSIPMQKVYKSILHGLCVKHEFLFELLSVLDEVKLTAAIFESCYRKSLPSSFKPKPGRLTLLRIVEHLADIPFQTHDGTLPLALFARNIAESLPSDSIADKLEEWIDRVKADLEPSLGRIQMSPKSHLLEKESNLVYLLVRVRSDPNNRANEKKMFTFSIYKWQDSENAPCVSGNKEFDKSTIVDVIDETIAKDVNESDRICAIEFMLPCELIHLDVNALERTDEEELSPKLAKDYPLLVRLERPKEKPHLRVRWIERWEYFNNMTRQALVDTCVHLVCGHEGYDPLKVYREYLEDDKTKTCLLQTFLPSDPFIFGKSILDAGIPIALWCNKYGHTQDDHEIVRTEMMKLIEDGDFNALQERVFERCRKSEHRKRLQDHLTLLWDDPGRLPRNLQKNKPTQEEY
jgi:hypothetical protein